LRVLIIQLSVGFSGTEKHAVELANGLSPHLDVAVLLRPKPAAPERHAEYDALRDAINSNIPVYLSSRGMLPFGLWNAIRRFRPDLIHAHYEGSARMAARWARPLGIPLIATIHTQYRHRSFGACDALIALTENERQRTRLFYHKEIALIENWVNCKAKPGPNRVVSLRTEFGIKNNSFVVGSVGRLEPIKRTKGIIDSFRAADLPESRLIVVGNGSEIDALKTYVSNRGLSERVCFAGFRADTWEIFSLFDVFVINSTEEAYGLVILEAAANNVKVIATATAGARAISVNLEITLIEIEPEAALSIALRNAYATQKEPAPPMQGFSFTDRLPDLLALYHRVRFRTDSGSSNGSGFVEG
jgi:glycosyltransferase involved in cell wall biosynthesis